MYGISFDDDMADRLFTMVILPSNLKTSKNAPEPQGPAGHGFGMRLNDRGVLAKMLLKLGVWRLGMLGLGQRRWSFKVCGGKR